jgi:hypothetical protein
MSSQLRKRTTMKKTAKVVVGKSTRNQASGRLEG